MNKLFSALAFTVAVFCAAAANAQFQGTLPAAITVEQAKGLADDTFVVLEGTITQQLGDEKYTFQDASGTITVEIDDEDWKGVKVQPTDVVVLTGTVDKDFTDLEIDIDTVALKK